MSVDVFSEWLRRQGHRVIQTESSYWHSQGVRALQAFPYHWTIHPQEGELTKLLRESKTVSLRYSTSMSAPLGRLSYHAVFEKSSYGMEDLGKWARKNVRRGLRNCCVEPISFECLADEGWALQQDTLERQGRNVKLGHEEWRQRCLAAADLSGFGAWGARVQGKLAASVITFLMGDCCYMLYQGCHSSFLKEHANNALSFCVTQAMVQQSNVRSIFYGLHSLDAPASVDEFKFRMGYEAKPVRQRVVFHPVWSPLFNPLTHAIVKAAKALRPGNPTLAKAEGIICFYLEGKRPLAEQAYRFRRISSDEQLETHEVSQA